MKLKNRTYNTLKFVALIVLPAAGTAYFAIASLWHLPHAAQVVGTITAVDTFLGAIQHVATKSYHVSIPNNGKFVIDKTDPKKDVYLLNVTTPISELSNLTHVVLKVEPGASIEMKTTRP